MVHQRDHPDLIIDGEPEALLGLFAGAVRLEDPVRDPNLDIEGDRDRLERLLGRLELAERQLSDIMFSFEPSEAAARIEQWCATLPVAAPEGEWVRADIEDHVRDEHSTYTWLLEAMLERSGLRIDTVDCSPDGFLADYVARAV